MAPLCEIGRISKDSSSIKVKQFYLSSSEIFTSEPVGRSESTDDIRPYKILEILTHGDQTSMVIKFIEVTELEFEVRNDL